MCRTLASVTRTGVATMLIFSAASSPSYAQQDSVRCLCVGVQLVTTNMNAVGYGVFGVGARVSVSMGAHVAVDFEFDRYTDNPDGYGGDIFVLGGLLARYPRGRNAIVARIRPGVAWFRSTFVTERNPGLRPKPALDVGIGFERVVAQHVNFRIELGYTAVFFGDDLIYRGTLEPHRPGVSFNPSLGVGLLLRL